MHTAIYRYGKTVKREFRGKVSNDINSKVLKYFCRIISLLPPKQAHFCAWNG